MKMLNWLFGNGGKLNVIENQLMEGIASAMPPEAADILRSQVALINKVQRLDGNREVDFYHIKNGKPAFPESALFPNRTEELLLARLHIKDPSTGHQSKAAITLVKGHLFSIEFSHTPKEFRGAPDLQITVEICADPMISAADSQRPQ